MERHVKQRLVGAAILLALVVLFVPEFLSGPKPSPQALPATLTVPMHSYTVDLNDPTRTTLQEAASAASPDPPPPSTTPAPVEAPGATPMSPPVAPGAAASTPAEATAAASIESAPNTPMVPVASGAIARPPARLASAKGAWGVQLGSFASKANAEKLAQLLQGKGYSVAVSGVGTGSAARFRVRIGQLADRESAQRLIARLLSQGHPATLVPPG
jgi:DedD protein